VKLKDHFIMKTRIDSTSRCHNSLIIYLQNSAKLTSATATGEVVTFHPHLTQCRRVQNDNRPFNKVQKVLRQTWRNF